MFYTIYKVTNTLNNKFYIGKHQTDNPNDRYYGSGKAIKSAIRKYGKKNFKKEILFCFDNELEMNAKEKEILTETFISDTMNYNEAVGGEGGPHFKGRQHSKETKEKISRGSKLSKKVVKHSEETINIMREKKRGANNPMFGRKMTKEQIEKRQQSRYKNIAAVENRESH